MLVKPKLGDDVLQTDIDQTEAVNEIVEEVDGIDNTINQTIMSLIQNIDGIVEYDFTANNGYVRFKDGFQIAWKNVNDTGLGELWQNFYISDTTMGNWKKPFTVLFESFGSTNFLQFWTLK